MPKAILCTSIQGRMHMVMGTEDLVGEIIVYTSETVLWEWLVKKIE